MTSTTPPRPSAAERLRAEHGPALTLGDDCGLPDDLVVEMLAGRLSGVSGLRRSSPRRHQPPVT